MDPTQIKHVIEAALLAAGRPLPFDKLASLFAAKGSELDRDTLRQALEGLEADYKERGLELKEVASGYRIQIRSSMTDWLVPLWEERAPRYTRALLETLALIAYRQPITRAEIEDVRGVAVSTNIIRTLMERSWIRVVGHRDVPGKPAMFGTTRDFLDYFGLRKLEDLPTLADIKEGLPEESPQGDFIDVLASGEEGESAEALALSEAEVSVVIAQAAMSEESEGEAEAEPVEVADLEAADDFEPEDFAAEGAEPEDFEPEDFEREDLEPEDSDAEDADSEELEVVVVFDSDSDAEDAPEGQADSAADLDSEAEAEAEAEGEGEPEGRVSEFDDRAPPSEAPEDETEGDAEDSTSVGLARSESH